MHKLCYRNVGERTYYSKLKWWDVLLSISHSVRAASYPGGQGFEGLLPEFMQKQTHFPNFAWLETQFFLQNTRQAKPIPFQEPAIWASHPLVPSCTSPIRDQLQITHLICAYSHNTLLLSVPFLTHHNFSLLASSTILVSLALCTQDHYSQSL